jgi:hypothetical protein
MKRGTILLIVAVIFAASLVLGCGTLAMGIHAGMVPEVLVWLPPRGKYQAVVRVGSDDLPWRGSSRRTAINVWVHGRGTDWHIIRLLHIPISANPPPSAR